jgi:hypothetical protein
MVDYSVQSLYEASFLACRGYQFKAKEKLGYKVALIYTDSEDLQKTVLEFYAGGMVPAKQFCDWYRTIKDYVFTK